jgi:AcrR family transcriptional regulator
MKKRLDPDLRRVQLIDAALDEAEAVGYSHCTRLGIAQRANVSEGLVSLYFGTMPQLRRQIVRHAVARSRLPIIAQALAAKDPHAQKAPPEVQRAALASLR